MAVPARAYDNGGNYKYPRGPRGKFPKLGIVLIIIVALFMSGIPMKIYNDITVYRHDKIKDYLDQREQLYSSSDLEFKQLLNKVYQSNSPNIQSLTLDIQQAKIVIGNNYSRFLELKPPRAFENLHDETLQWYLQKNSAIDYLQAAAVSYSYHPNSFKPYIDTINLTVSNIKPKFIEGLQKANLKYQINADGSITYWVKQDAFQKE